MLHMNRTLSVVRTGVLNLMRLGRIIKTELKRVRRSQELKC